VVGLGKWEREVEGAGELCITTEVALKRAWWLKNACVKNDDFGLVCLGSGEKRGE
jgi:hypothetical protein